MNLSCCGCPGRLGRCVALGTKVGASSSVRHCGTMVAPDPKSANEWVYSPLVGCCRAEKGPQWSLQ